jgi:hypothetical protein
MRQIINGRQYDTDKAVLVTSDRYWDGHNFERYGRNMFLYRTAKGNFFLHHTTQWQRDSDRLEPLSIEEAKVRYEQLPEYEMGFKEAFGEDPEEA